MVGASRPGCAPAATAGRLRHWLLPAGMVFLSACASLPAQHVFQMPAIDPANSGNPMWPALPEVPRYAFIGHLYGESNARASATARGGLARLFAAIVGLDGNTRERVDLLRPQQLASDERGRVYVVDTGRQAIFVFDETLGEFTLWNESGLGIPLLSPVGIAVAGDSVYISDSELAVVYRFDAGGELLGRIGEGLLERPTGIAVDPAGERLFVSDTAASRIALFDLDGRPAGTWGRFGSRPGELNRPTYVSYRDGRLYVADSLNARVQVFDPAGRHLQTIGERGLYVGNFSRPKGVALDSDGNLYVVESYYDHVLIYNPRGELLLAIGGSGAAPGQFSLPTGIWVDARDRVYVSDMLNGRVSLFQYLGGN